NPNWRAFVPTGIYIHCWKSESVSEFRGDVDAGRGWLGVMNRNDTVSSQIVFELKEEINPPPVPGKWYGVQLQYRTVNDAEGQILVRNRKNGDFPSIAETRLDRTDGKWKTVELTFRCPVGGKLDVCVENTTVGEGNTLYVRALEVFEPNR